MAEKLPKIKVNQKTKISKSVRVKDKIDSVKTVKKTSLKSRQHQNKKQADGMMLNVVNLQGASGSKIKMPEELFNAKINNTILAQAVRVHLANKREASASAKTRSEVEGSTRKIYRQKGTGRARHGNIRAGIFVGGGVIHGPKNQRFSLKMPKKMKNAALKSALSVRFQQGDVVVVDGFEKLKLKTKVFAQALSKAGFVENTLLIIDKNAGDIKRCMRNIAGLNLTTLDSIYAYQIMKHKKIFIQKQVLQNI